MAQRPKSTSKVLDETIFDFDESPMPEVWKKRLCQKLSERGPYLLLFLRGKSHMRVPQCPMTWSRAMLKKLEKLKNHLWKMKQEVVYNQHQTLWTPQSLKGENILPREKWLRMKHLWKNLPVDVPEDV
ncbi:unnamed protein product [Merluccius merluccius]